MRACEMNLIGMSLTTYLQSLIIVLEQEGVQKDKNIEIEGNEET